MAVKMYPKHILTAKNMVKYIEQNKEKDIDKIIAYLDLMFVKRPIEYWKYREENGPRPEWLTEGK